jgi:ribosome-binding protein aMBF1 (putative translation factor)
LTGDNLGAIVREPAEEGKMSKAPELKSHGTLVAEEMNRDPEFREEWGRMALGRLVAAQLVGYRADHGLSQRALGEKLGRSQPHVAKLESGEVNPDLETLVSISRALGIEFMIDIAPAARAPKLVTRSVAARHAAQQRDGVAVVMAAA